MAGGDLQLRMTNNTRISVRWGFFDEEDDITLEVGMKCTNKHQLLRCLPLAEAHIKHSFHSPQQKFMFY